MPPGDIFFMKNNRKHNKLRIFLFLYYNPLSLVNVKFNN